eukprot:1261129-Amphidinium_carterae.1
MTRVMLNHSRNGVSLCNYVAGLLHIAALPGNSARRHGSNGVDVRSMATCGHGAFLGGAIPWESEWHSASIEVAHVGGYRRPKHSMTEELKQAYKALKPLVVQKEFCESPLTVHRLRIRKQLSSPPAVSRHWAGGVGSFAKASVISVPSRELQV